MSGELTIFPLPISATNNSRRDHTAPGSGSIRAFMDDPAAEPSESWTDLAAAIYGLERPIRCPSCREELDHLCVVRLYRLKVNFVSSLPRSGRVLVCPRCQTPVPGELGAVI